MIISESDGAELMDELKISPDIRLNSELLLSGTLQQVGSMEWIMYKPRWGAYYNTILEKYLHNIGVNLGQLSMKQVNEISELFWLKMLHLLSMISHCRS